MTYTPDELTAALILLKAVAKGEKSKVDIATIEEGLEQLSDLETKKSKQYPNAPSHLEVPLLFYDRLLKSIHSLIKKYSDTPDVKNSELSIFADANSQSNTRENSPDRGDYREFKK